VAQRELQTMVDAAGADGASGADAARQA